MGDRIRRVLANAGWMLGGQVVTGVLSLIYLALATRSLGMAGFGTFSMILAVSQAVGTIVAFQSWQVVVHYGVGHLESGRHEHLSRLLWFCAGLDLAGAAFGSILSIAACTGLASAFGWSAGTATQAAAFCVATMFGIRSAPVGVMRLHDRYAMAAGAEAIAPVIKAVGAMTVAAMGWGLPGFLAVWAAADLTVSAACWILSGAGCGAPWRIGARPDATGAVADNAGLWCYALTTNAASSLRIASRSLAVLIVGTVAGPVAAGAYRLCLQLSQASARISQTISKAVFPEFARARLTCDDEVRAIFIGITRLVGSLALASALLLPLAGPTLLSAIGGTGYGFALPALYVMGAAAVIDMAGSALDPVLMASGRAGSALSAGLCCAIATVALMIPAASSLGALGAAGAVLAGSMISIGMEMRAAVPVLRRRKESGSGWDGLATV